MKKAKHIELDFEVGKTYKAKWCEPVNFTITKIDYSKVKGQKDVIVGFWGIYEDKPHIGICPLNVGRLHPEVAIIEVNVEICECCGREK